VGRPPLALRGGAPPARSGQDHAPTQRCMTPRSQHPAPVPTLSHLPGDGSAADPSFAPRPLGVLST
jgi:hypothetical protein